MLLILAWRFWVINHLGITLYVDEAQYWTWARQLDWGYFSKPPGIAALIWLSTHLFGDGINGVKALAMLCYPLSAMVCWAIAKRLYDTQTANWSALVVLTLPIFSWLGLFVSTDALLALFWALALWAYLGAIDNDSWGDWVLLGIINGLGLLAKYPMAIWMSAAFLHLLFFQRSKLRSAKPWVAVGLAALILSPNIYWNFAHDFPTLKHTADITLNRASGGGLKSLGEFIAAQWAAFGPILGSVFVLLLISSRESWKDRNTRLLLWFSLPLWAVVSAQAMKSGANANWAAPAFAPASIAVVAWLLKREKNRLLIAGVVINLLLAIVVYHWPQWLAAVNVENSAKINPLKRAQGWDELGRQLQPIIEAHPDSILIADSRTLLAHMSYELRGINIEAASWNPSGAGSDHYKLTTNLNRHIGKDLMLISETPPGEGFTGHFSHIEKIASLNAPLDSKTSRKLDVYLLHAFKGY